MRIRWTAGLRFLHLVIRTAGHGKGKQEPGMESPVQAEVVAGLENPSCMRRRRDAEQNSSEAAAHFLSKSRYRVARRTVNRHRWMREDPKAGGRSVVKELGKMTP